MAGQNTKCVNCETNCKSCKPQSDRWKEYASEASRADNEVTVDDIPGLREVLLEVVNGSLDDAVRYRVGRFLR